MRKLSLLLAASVMAVGLAVSGGANAEYVPTNYEVLSKGEILMTSVMNEGHVFTVDYDGAIYGCLNDFDRMRMECIKIRGNEKKADGR